MAGAVCAAGAYSAGRDVKSIEHEEGEKEGRGRALGLEAKMEALGWGLAPAASTWTVSRWVPGLAWFSPGC